MRQVIPQKPGMVGAKWAFVIPPQLEKLCLFAYSAYCLAFPPSRPCERAAVIYPVTFGCN